MFTTLTVTRAEKMEESKNQYSVLRQFLDKHNGFVDVKISGARHKNTMTGFDISGSDGGKNEDGRCLRCCAM